jgi:hypothetical protein
MAEAHEGSIEELSNRIEALEEEVRLARRAAEGTRRLAIILVVLYVGLPLLFSLLSLFRIALFP